MRLGPFGRRGQGRFRRSATRPRMTDSKAAAIRTAIAVMAALFLAGCGTGDHGVKRMAGAGLGGGGCVIGSTARSGKLGIAATVAGTMAGSEIGAPRAADGATWLWKPDPQRGSRCLHSEGSDESRTRPGQPHGSQSDGTAALSATGTLPAVGKTSQKGPRHRRHALGAWTSYLHRPVTTT